MLELKAVVAQYGNIRVLHQVDISIHDQEIVTLIGANGAGKSTTLMAISGVVPVTEGSIRLDGVDIHDISPDKIVSRGISHVPEGRRIFPYLTVQENLRMGAILRRDKPVIQRDLEFVFSLFPLLQERYKQMGGTLSGGEQQMLAIGRALMARPRLLLLDEPSLGLAPILVQQIVSIIKEINTEHKVTIFLVEQNAHLALKIADRGYVMETGTIILHDKAELLSNSPEVQKAYMGQA